MYKDEQQNLRVWARNYGIELSESQIGLFSIYLKELWAWNKRMNLTGLSSHGAIIKELLLDSLIPSPLLPKKGKLLDVGSGAGFPAIPLKICKPGLEVCLIEAKSRKVSFLKQVIRLTKLSDIEAVQGRVENDKGLLRPEGYDIITARALAHLPQTLTWCAPHLAPGGLIINFQGSQFENAIKENSDITKRQGLFLHKSIPYTLPGKEDSRRCLLIFKKHGSSPD